MVLAQNVWSKKLLILKLLLVFVLIGIVVSLLIPIEYEASTKLLPESGNRAASSMGGLGSLAGLAGVDIGALSRNEDALSPKLYPEIVKSVPFVLDIMSDTIHFENIDKSTTSFDYFQNHVKPTALGVISKYTIGLPSLVKSFFTDPIVDKKLSYDSSDEYYRLNKLNKSIMESFRDRYFLSYNEETGIIYISAFMPDPYAAAEIVKKIEFKVRETVTNYKTEKAKASLAFISKAYEEAKVRYQKEELRLATFNDRNFNVSSSRAQIEKKRLENNFNIAYEVYKGLTGRLEQAKIQLNEETPVFTVLEPIQIPNTRSRPKRMLIVFVFGTCGIVLGIAYCIIKELFFA